MKRRVVNIMLALLMLAAALPFSGCSILDKILDKKDEKPDTPVIDTGYGSDDHDQLADYAVQFAATGDVEYIKRLLPESELKYYEDYYRENKNLDYWQVLSDELAAQKEHYNEVCGNDWVITYEMTQCNDKDEEGINKYREFDSFYFEQYNMDPAKISDVSFIYYDVTITGSLGSNTKQKSMWTFCYEGRWYSFYMPRFGLSLM